MRQKMLLKEGCPECHASTPAGSKFCSSCGARLASRLPHSIHD
ncbi:zinc-ribbon domain-containing protein [Pseudomonas aeruginosa]